MSIMGSCLSLSVLETETKERNQGRKLVEYMSEHTAYHSSKQSLMMTIVNLVQDYIKSNNLSLLLP